jgi:SAM-dependent methyltransferase
MAKETSKAMRRRMIENSLGVFPWLEILKGEGLDVGAGDDPLQIGGCQHFDKDDGDAEKLDELIAHASLDYLHASQCLEHMLDPADALARWFRCVRKGGHLVISVPDFDLFEKRLWPSKWNPDHEAGFSLWRKSYPNCPLFYHVPTMLSGYNVKLLRLVATNFNYNLSDEVDQTWHESDGVEAFIEFVIQK